MRHTFAILLLLVAGLRSQVLAATVTSTADSGPGSLRTAIAGAAPGDTIVFSVTGAITLTSGELLINKDLIISGPGMTNLTIQRSTAAGAAEFRIFNVDSGIVTISGLAMQNGSASGSSGGGLLNQTTLTLRDSAIIGNSASIVGGGIMNLSTLIMSNCVIQSNSVLGITNADASGGGIHNSGGTLTLLSCTVSSNSVSAHAGT